MKIVNKPVIQVHKVPDKVEQPQGPFPPHLRGYNPKVGASLGTDGADFDSFDVYDEQAHPAAQPDLIYTDGAYEEDGSGFALGATVQNNYKPPKYLRCAACLARVLEHETEAHVCSR